MRRAEFDDVMNGLVRPDGPGAAVAVRQGGEMVHSVGYGLANVEWRAPIDAETVFRIGSITKQFTAAAILRLAADGKLAIDDPIERHLPDFPVGERRITLRHLLNHTSGIKSYTAMPLFMEIMARDLPLAELIAKFRDAPPDFAPGERYRYNNSGYVLLGAVIEAASGQSYEAYLKETFFEPLGLTHTSYLHNGPIVPKRASGYMQMRTLLNASPISMNLPHAAGALGSTAEDLLAWELALRSGQAVAPADYQAMITPGALSDGAPISYGFGLLNQTYRGRRSIGHGGGINGFLSHLAYWPDSDLAIAVVSNSGSFPVQQAAFALARRAMGEADLVREPVTLDEATLASCAGGYRFELDYTLPFEIKDGGLASPFPRVGSLFRPFGPRTFFLVGDAEVTLRFDELQDGLCQRVTITSYGGDPSIGVRAPPAA